jgi:mannose-1-phosphate guanylyltransferase
VLERSLLDEMAPPGTNISIERDVFPTLVGGGLYGFEAEGYWLDIGTPERYLQGTFDILEANVQTDLAAMLEEARYVIADGAHVEGRIVAPALVGPGSSVARGAIVGGRAVLGRNVSVATGAHIEGSVVMDGASIGAGTHVSASIVGPASVVGDRCHIERGVVLGERVRVGAGNVLTAGARLFPGVELPDGAIRF